MADAKHKPRISSMSFGLLISELDNNSFADSANTFRELKGIPDSERATLRSIAKWVLGLPVAIAVVGFLALQTFRGNKDDEVE
jgi:hypothetical protein